MVGTYNIIFKISIKGWVKIGESRSPDALLKKYPHENGYLFTMINLLRDMVIFNANFETISLKTPL